MAFRRAPSIEGIVESVHAGGYVQCDVVNEFGEFIWRSKIDEFLQAWEKSRAAI